MAKKSRMGGKDVETIYKEIKDKNELALRYA
jgi:hypothetical protein